MKKTVIAIQLLGLAAIVFGIYLIWIPAALIAAGVALCFVAERMELSSE